MAKKAKKDNKNMIIGGICAAVAVVVVIVLAVVLATGGNKLDDSYFVSDGSKYVLTIESDDLEFDEEEEAYAPIKTHLVYTYSGDEITGLKTYAEYADAASAKAALEAMKAAGEDVSEISIDGKYLVMTATPDQYEGMTASDVKQQIEFMEMMKNMDLDDSTTEEGEVVEDGTDEAIIEEETE